MPSERDAAVHAVYVAYEAALAEAQERHDQECMAAGAAWEAEQRAAIVARREALAKAYRDHPAGGTDATR